MKKFILAFLALALSQNALAVDDWIEPYGTYLNTNKASAVKIYYTMGGRGEDMVSSSLCDKRGALTMTTSVSTKELQMIKIEGSHPCFPAATYKKISDDINKSGSKYHK